MTYILALYDRHGDEYEHAEFEQDDAGFASAISAANHHVGENNAIWYLARSTDSVIIAQRCVDAASELRPLRRPDFACFAGFVYVVNPTGHNVYKIGYSVNPPARHAKLESGKLYRLEVVCLIWSENCQQLESELHRQYEAYRLSGEWFALPEAAIQELKARINGD